MDSASTPRRGRRTLKTFKQLPRTPVLNFARKVVDADTPMAATKAAPETAPGMLNGLGAFLPGRIVEWTRQYIKHRIGPMHPLPTYPQGNDNGVYTVPNTVKIGMAGDWGSGTDVSAQVASEMMKLAPEITLHLGDVYYVGDAAEVRENCLGENNPKTKYDPTEWPKGSLGSLALNGNHEMYARGFGYFDHFLPTLGMTGRGPQKSSYFCLENSFWRIVALDTGYYSVGMPILEKIPFLNRIPRVGGDCHLDEQILKWLRETVEIDDVKDTRPIILLSHHQYYSAFDGNHTRAAIQLAPLIKKTVLWFWGHEHRLAAYDAYAVSGGIKAHGRCLGNGGMPVELIDAETVAEARAARPRLRFVDNRPDPDHADLGVGLNGFACLEFQDELLTVIYKDRTGAEVFREQWLALAGEPVLAVQALEPELVS